MTAVLIIEAVAILLLGVLVVGLLRSHAEILRALHDLGVTDEPGDRTTAVSMRPQPRLSDNPPSDITGQTLSGSVAHVGVSGSDGRTLLAFLSSGCSSCIGLWDDLRMADHEDVMPGSRLVLVTKSPEAESLSRLKELAPKSVTLVQSTQAWEAYGVPVSPYFVLVDGGSGTIVGEGSATSWGQVRSLMNQAVGDLAARREVNAESGEFVADAALREAGIGPGHSSLYPDGPPVSEPQK